MKLIEDKIKALYEFKYSINETIAETMQNNKEVIIDMNATSQLNEQGINSQGILLDSFQPYTARTISIKRAKGQPFDRVTLRDSGDFQASIHVLFYNDGFMIQATDIKTNDLIAKYGEDILGLTDEHIAELIWNYSYPAINNKLHSLL